MSKIIVVDDDYSTTSLVRMLLEMDGHAVTTCVEPEKALAAAREGVKAFIIDCYLDKKTSGIDLLRSIREHENPSIREAPVIMVSGDQRLTEEVTEAGADRFLLKPYSPADLSQQVEDVIAARAGGD